MILKRPSPPWSTTFTTVSSSAICSYSALFNGVGTATLTWTFFAKAASDPPSSSSSSIVSTTLSWTALDVDLLGLWDRGDVGALELSFSIGLESTTSISSDSASDMSSIGGMANAVPGTLVGAHFRLSAFNWAVCLRSVCMLRDLDGPLSGRWHAYYAS